MKMKVAHITLAQLGGAVVAASAEAALRLEDAIHRLAKRLVHRRAGDLPAKVGRTDDGLRDGEKRH